MTGRMYVREDGEKILLPGARQPVDLDAARRVWDEGLCTQTDPEVFFPEVGGNPEAARKICAACPVRWLCLETFDLAVDHGVVGGFTPTERHALRRKGRGVAA
jgi:WhiB family redox-sensing transcriptional regulator